jgi:hypothetical protein
LNRDRHKIGSAAAQAQGIKDLLTIGRPYRKLRYAAAIVRNRRNSLLHVLEEALKAPRKRPVLHYGDNLFTTLLECLGSSTPFQNHDAVYALANPN